MTSRERERERETADETLCFEMSPLGISQAVVVYSVAYETTMKFCPF